MTGNISCGSERSFGSITEVCGFPSVTLLQNSLSTGMFDLFHRALMTCCPAWKLCSIFLRSFCSITSKSCGSKKTRKRSPPTWWMSASCGAGDETPRQCPRPPCDPFSYAGLQPSWRSRKTRRSSQSQEGLESRWPDAIDVLRWFLRCGARGTR